MKYAINKRNIYWYTITIFLSINSFLLVYIDNAIYKINIILFIIAGIILVFKKNYTIRISKPIKYWLLFLIWSSLTCLWATVKHLDTLIVLWYISFIVLILYNLMNNEYTYLIFIRAIILSILMLSLYVLMYFGIDTLTTSRMSNDVLNSNTFGSLCSYGVILSYFLYKRKKQKYYMLISLFLIIMVLISGSKTALFGLILAATIFILIENDRSKKDIFKAFVIVFIFVIVLYILITRIEFLYNIIGERIQTFFLLITNHDFTNQHESTGIRYTMIIEGIELFFKNPIFGYGVNSYMDYSSFMTYSHNTLIELLVNSGIIGTLFFYMIFISILIKVKNKKINSYWKALILSITCMLVATSFTSIFYNNIAIHIILCIFNMYLYPK